LASAAHADRITQVIPLKAIDSRQLVAMFSASSQALRDDPSAYRQAFANRCAQKALTAAQRRRRNVQPQWYVNNELALVPEYGAVLGGPSPVLLAQAPQTGPGGQGPDGGGAAGGAQRRSGGAMLQLPEGMDPPVAIMQQNAILVKGEQAAIDQFQDSPHHSGAVEETAQNGFAFAMGVLDPFALGRFNNDAHEAPAFISGQAHTE